MAKIKDIYTQWRQGLAERKENVYRMIELKRLKRLKSKYTPPYEHCQNCGTKLQGMYCHECGQFAHDYEQPFWKYLWQYFENVYQFDSKIPITVWHLFRRPGFLTNEFNAGKIRSYMHPMKLNMFVLMLFFTLVVIMGKKIVERKFTQANIPEYISSNIDVNENYFNGKDTTLFFIGNRHLLSDYPEIFTIKESFTDEYSIEGVTDNTLPDSTFQDSPHTPSKSIYSYKDEQESHDTLLIKAPKVFIRDGILINSYTPVSKALMERASTNNDNLEVELSKIEKLTLDNIMRIAQSTGEIDSTALKEIETEIGNISAAYFYRVTSKKKFTKIDQDNLIKKNYVDEFLSITKTWLPIIFLLTMPFLALILKLVYRKKRMNYMCHFVFSLHYCSMMFILLFFVLILLAFVDFIPGNELFKWYLALIFIYFIIASHTVYSGTGWIKSILKSAFTLLIYVVATGTVLFVLFIIFVVQATLT